MRGVVLGATVESGGEGPGRGEDRRLVRVAPVAISGAAAIVAATPSSRRALLQRQLRELAAPGGCTPGRQPAGPRDVAVR